MTLEERIQSLGNWGRHLSSIDSSQLDVALEKASLKNRWFTKSNCHKSLLEICKWLNPEVISSWVGKYSLSKEMYGKAVGLIMAGNIPLVGFHDLFCVLLAGHNAKIKLSSQDDYLIPYLIDVLEQLDSRWIGVISFEDRLKNLDAVIATGSDNSARYFNYYFKDLPRIIRKNRTSVGIIMGEENSREFEKLGSDVFTYFGMGCRNVSKIYVPENFELDILFKPFAAYQDCINHNKFFNNYEYQKSIRLISTKKFIDFGFLILEESNDLVSPIAVLYYEYYSNQEHLRQQLNLNEAKTQCIVSANGWLAGSMPFGTAQQPAVDDYSDGIDTIKFLESI